MRDWNKLGEDLTAVWGDADGLVHAFELANSGINDDRTMRRARRKLEAMGYELPPINDKFCTAHHIECPSTLDLDSGSTSYVITSCTNNSELNFDMLTALESFSAHNGSQLLVIPVNYRNISLMSSNSDYDWPSRVYPYILLDDLNIQDSLLVSATRIRATAVHPLSGMQPIGKQMSVIYGHPQLAMEMVASPASQTPKMMHTTGSCNEGAYSATKDGKKASFHHSDSALYVQMLDDGRFTITQLCWDGKGFNFFQERWDADGRQPDQDIAALHMGDYHTRALTQEVFDWRQGVIAATNPEALIWNDLHDHRSQNHHNTKMDRILIAARGEHLVKDEIMLSVEAVNEVGKDRKNYIVESNHDDALMRWMNEFKDANDPHNAPYYWELMSLKFAYPDRHALELAMEGYLEVDYEFVGRDDWLNVKGIDVSQHGDKGPNGSRGSATGFAKTTYKTIIGHSHTPRILHGCWQNGVSSKDMDYNKGFSSWVICDIMIYQSGRTAFSFFVEQ